MGAQECRSWLEREGRKFVWLAGRLGVDATLVSHWLAGRRAPSPDQAKAIEVLSNGAVKRSIWNCETISNG